MIEALVLVLCRVAVVFMFLALVLGFIVCEIIYWPFHWLGLVADRNFKEN